MYYFSANSRSYFINENHNPATSKRKTSVQLLLFHAHTRAESIKKSPSYDGDFFTGLFLYFLSIIVRFNIDQFIVRIDADLFRFLINN